MIIILSIILSLFRFKQKVSCQHFKNHASAWPNISACIIRVTNDSFRGSVLSSLDLRSEVMVVPTSISHVNYCHMTIFSQFRASFWTSLSRFWYNRFSSRRWRWIENLISDLFIQIVFLRLRQWIVILWKSTTLYILFFLLPSLLFRLCLFFNLDKWLCLFWRIKKFHVFLIKSRNKSCVVCTCHRSLLFIFAFSKGFCIS